jgi:putative flavoprotein involved in K+ transport
LDLKSAGITSVIWATGYKFDFSLVKLPAFDEDGYPLQKRGVTEYPGLYFIGLPALHTSKSGLLHGVGEDAAYVAAYIDSHTPPEPAHSADQLTGFPTKLITQNWVIEK